MGISAGTRLGPYVTDVNHKFPRTFYPSADDPEHAIPIHVDEGQWLKDVIVHVAAKSISQ